ncbi:uncharacterized protein [Primulina eburnea]|uniref:uncharacterized protein isoform X1 n=1 Tax=Primulina eburnea TaxID=1245227 RepID=UPI003C6C68B1
MTCATSEGLKLPQPYLVDFQDLAPSSLNLISPLEWSIPFLHFRRDKGSMKQQHSKCIHVNPGSNWTCVHILRRHIAVKKNIAASYIIVDIHWFYEDTEAHWPHQVQFESSHSTPFCCRILFCQAILGGSHLSCTRIQELAFYSCSTGR